MRTLTHIALLAFATSFSVVPASAQQADTSYIRSDLAIGYVPNTFNGTIHDRPWFLRSVIFGHDSLCRGFDCTIRLSGPLSGFTDTMRNPRFSNIPRIRRLYVGVAYDLSNDVVARVFVQSATRVGTGIFIGGKLRF